ncbi:thiamine phosphate synthase [Paraburkholderia hayleyella]|uniref:thiamine phosphate synthase n=1 Tax=Paraburkholderia hayleyella TaxID=2152889 RepID=UPI0012915CC2|nr:thiamine phosphate synthase [Paraburkholderia hayleyella]
MSLLWLPTRYLITPEPEPDPVGAGTRDGQPETLPEALFEPFLERLAAALARGIRLVQLRAKTLEPHAYTRLAEASASLCRQHQAHLILNGPALSCTGTVMESSGAAGLHLSSAHLMACRTRPVPATCWLSAACHTSAELAQAERLGATFVTLSPVLATASHPDTPPLGWEAFAAMAARANVPVFALGGMTPEHLAWARAQGAHGIAAIRGLW